MKLIFNVFVPKSHSGINGNFVVVHENLYLHKAVFTRKLL